MSIDELKQGRDLYVNNCASCHQLYLPNKYTAKDWHYWLDDMQPKAKITDAQKQLIYDYLVNAPK
jgi:mono/diheme cytochrome c family protein